MSRVTQAVVELILVRQNPSKKFPHGAQKSLKFFYTSPIVSQALYLRVFLVIRVVVVVMASKIRVARIWLPSTFPTGSLVHPLLFNRIVVVAIKFLCNPPSRRQTRLRSDRCAFDSIVRDIAIILLSITLLWQRELVRFVPSEPRIALFKGAYSACFQLSPEITIRRLYLTKFLSRLETGQAGMTGPTASFNRAERPVYSNVRNWK
jgi:hypothetical protein